MQSTSHERRLAVWSSFEFDLRTLELRRRGLRLRLEHKPACVLGRLLEQQGQIVERDDLVKLLWPDEASGDFDLRLNKALHKVRCALGDDPLNPRFVQTLSRRGYRFIADVQILNGNNGLSAGAVNTESKRAIVPALHEDAITSESLSAAGGTPRNVAVPSSFGQLVAAEGLSSGIRAGWLRAAVAAGLVLIACFISFEVFHRAHPSAPHVQSIAILSFTNLSGNPADQWFSVALGDWLASDLTAGANLRAIPRDYIARFQAEQRLQDSDRISPQVLAKMSHDLGADLVLSGSYASSGTDAQSQMRLDVQVRDSRSGKLLSSVNATGSRAEIFDLVTSAGAQLRIKLRLGPIDATALSAMRSILPANPDAARFYAEGTDEIERFDPVDAQVLLQRSVALEPDHALSHAALSTAYTMLGFSAEAKIEAAKALDRADTLPTEQRLLVQGQFYETTYQWQRAIDVYSRLFQLFPGSADNGIRLSRAQSLAGKPLLALDTIAQLRQSQFASDDEARIDLVEAEAADCISDFRREKDAAARAAERARQSSATQLLARAEEREGEALRALGDFPGALALWKDAETRYVDIGDRSAVARVLIDQGRVHWQQGDPQAADASYSRSASISKEIGDEASLGRALSALAQVRMYYVSSAEGNRLCKQALAIFRTIGNKQEEAYTLSIMADISFVDHKLAIKLYQQSLELSREVNDRSRIAGRLQDLGIQATVEGDLPSADHYLQQSLAIYHEIGERNREALQMNLLSIVRTWQGRLDEAGKLSNQAVATLASVGEIVQLAQSRQNLGRVQMLEGHFADAEATLNLALHEHQDAHNPGGVAITSGQLAELFLLEGKLAESKAALKQYDEVSQIGPKGQPVVGEHVTERAIVAARIDAADGKVQRARSQAALAVNEALKADQGSMLMKARLALGEIELESGNKASGRRDLEILAADSDKNGFGLISSEARRMLAPAAMGAPNREPDSGTSPSHSTVAANESTGR